MTEQPEPYSVEDAEISARITRRILERVAAYAEDDPGSMAALLKRFAHIEGILSDERLADRLDLSTTSLQKLRLCLRPNSASPLFGEQVTQVARWVGMEESVLANLVRQVEAIDAIQGTGAGRQAEVRAAYSFQPGRPAMLAARDRAASSDPGSLRESSAPEYKMQPRPQASPAPAKSADEASEPDAAPPDATPDAPANDTPATHKPSDRPD